MKKKAIKQEVKTYRIAILRSGVSLTNLGDLITESYYLQAVLKTIDAGWLYNHKAIVDVRLIFNNQMQAGPSLILTGFKFAVPVATLIQVTDDTLTDSELAWQRLATYALTAFTDCLVLVCGHDQETVQNLNLAGEIEKVRAGSKIVYLEQPKLVVLASSAYQPPPAGTALLTWFRTLSGKQ